MPEFIVAIDHITYYASRPRMKSRPSISSWGEGQEISSETRDAYISEEIRASEPATTRVTPEPSQRVIPSLPD